MTHTPLKGLKLRREQSDYAQHELGAAIGVTQSQYHKFEAGIVRLDVHRAAMLAKMLGCHVEDLL